MTATFHSKNPAMQDSILVFNQDCELVSQLPIFFVYDFIFKVLRFDHKLFFCDLSFFDMEGIEHQFLRVHQGEDQVIHLRIIR